MQETAEMSLSSATGFASLLADLALPAPQEANRWNDDGYGDDIATLSYEQALRTHARYRAPDSDASRLDAKPTASSRKLPSRHATCDESRKSASITIRVSQAEYAQLRERAAAAGLTVSAYLRSCTLEVEALRAEVKEALAKFSSVAALHVQVPKEPSASGSTWRSRLFPRWSNTGRRAQTQST
jgi:hypothetical protein